MPCADPEGTGGPDPLPPKNHKNIEFLSNTRWTGSPEILKTTKPAFNVGPSSARQRNAIYRRLAGGSMIAFEEKKRCQSLDTYQIRMEFRKKCFVKSNIWAYDRKHAKHQYCRISDFVVQKPMRTRSIFSTDT